MKTELTEQQIERLFAFCRKHYVQYYDVQLELVDHLANAIEDKMNNDKTLSFEDALNKVYKGFGITGFSKVVAAKERAVAKQCNKMKWKLYWSYFTPPKLALTVCIFMSFVVLKKLIAGDYLLFVLFGLFMFMLVFEIISLFQAKWRLKKYSPKLLIMQNYSRPLISTVFFYSVMLSHVFNGNILTNLYYFGFGVLFTLTFVAILSYRNYVKQLFNLAKN